MKIALVPFNPTIGRVRENAEEILRRIHEAAASGAEVAVFPELALPGYPPKDLLDRRELLDANETALRRIGRETPIPAIVGYVEREGRALYNSAAYLTGGGVADPSAVVRKTHLPTYDVFDEDRWFERGSPADPIFIGAGSGLRRIGVSICEDLWPDPREEEGGATAAGARVAPIYSQVGSGAEFLLNISASPYHREKPQERRGLLVRHARAVGKPILYLNAYGGNDDLLFDGEVLVVDGQGRVLLERIFSDETALLDLDDLPAPILTPLPPWPETVGKAIVLGIGDFFRKCGLRTAVVGLSGGFDSAIVAALAVRALGAGNVRGVFLPSAITSSASREDARAVARALGIEIQTIPIEPSAAAIRESLAGVDLSGVAGENIQSRVRGLLLNALANAHPDTAILGTGNKSELAVGYATLYGDLIGALLPVGDCTKTRLYEIGRRLAPEHPGFPERVFSKPPTAELRPGQTDADDLLPYSELDVLVEAFVEEGRTVAEVVDSGIPRARAERVRGLLERSEFKRKQAPPILKVTRRAFGPGWQIPIAAHRPAGADVPA